VEHDGRSARRPEGGRRRVILQAWRGRADELSLIKGSLVSCLFGERRGERVLSRIKKAPAEDAIIATDALFRFAKGSGKSDKFLRW